MKEEGAEERKTSHLTFKQQTLWIILEIYFKNHFFSLRKAMHFFIV